MGLPFKTIWKMHLVQNRAARCLIGTGWFDHIRRVLCQLHRLPDHLQTPFKVLVLSFKGRNGLGIRLPEKLPFPICIYANLKFVFGGPASSASAKRREAGNH